MKSAFILVMNYFIKLLNYIVFKLKLKQLC